MANIYAFNQAAECLSELINDPKTIFVFEQIDHPENNQHEKILEKYDIDCINHILCSSKWEDHMLKGVLVEKMVELQNFVHKHDDVDYGHRYQLLLEGLSASSITNVRRLRYNTGLGERLPQGIRDQFMQAFLFDWANTRPKDPERGHFLGREWPQNGEVDGIDMPEY